MISFSHVNLEDISANGKPTTLHEKQNESLIDKQFRKKRTSSFGRAVDKTKDPERESNIKDRPKSTRLWNRVRKSLSTIVETDKYMESGELDLTQCQEFLSKPSTKHYTTLNILLKNGSLTKTRTWDLDVNSILLYQLS